MATITRSDFANSLRERFGLTTADAYKMIHVVFDEIRDALVNARLEKLGTEEYAYAFSEGLDYELEEFIMTYADLAGAEDEE